MTRTLVVGDIHGGLKGLKQILNRAEVGPNDYLIFLGDYVDGWSESAQVIDFLIDLEQTNKCLFIYGNHDAWCHDWLDLGQLNSVWYNHGGKETIKSYEGFTAQQKEVHLRFFKRMKNYWVDDTNLLFIHAGFSSMHGPKKEHYQSNYGWDRTLWEMALALHGKLRIRSRFYPNRLKLFKEIYIGHTPTTKWGVFKPWRRMNVWNIDTGAAFLGKLSILDIDSKKYWQSDTLAELYPNENGRNK